MSDRAFSGYVPSGRYTTSVRRYLREWSALTGPMCKKLGVKRSSFDPEVVVFDPKTGKSVQLPVWFINRINAALSEPDAEAADKT